MGQTKLEPIELSASEMKEPGKTGSLGRLLFVDRRFGLIPCFNPAGSPGPKSARSKATRWQRAVWGEKIE
jgi:hypothetical protein